MIIVFDLILVNESIMINVYPIVNSFTGIKNGSIVLKNKQQTVLDSTEKNISSIHSKSLNLFLTPLSYQLNDENIQK
jgi:hypothetical protein